MKLLLTLILVFIGFLSFGQPTTALNDRFIEVSGEGEVKVDPNILYLSIQLKEYKKESKIVKLEELEAQLTKVIQDLGVPAENLKVNASSGRQNELKKRNAELLISKRYNLKLTDVDLLNPLLGALGDANIFSVSVSEATHTDIEKFKSEARVKAIKNAKEKATLLVSAVDGKLGQVLQIRETELNDVYPLMGQLPGVRRMEEGGMAQNKVANRVDFEQLKLTYKIMVKFRIE